MNEWVDGVGREFGRLTLSLAVECAMMALVEQLKFQFTYWVAPLK